MRQVLFGQLKYTTWVTTSATSDAIPFYWNVLAPPVSLSKLFFFLQGSAQDLPMKPAQSVPEFLPHSEVIAPHLFHLG